jgi:hypothetical protein
MKAAVLTLAGAAMGFAAFHIVPAVLSAPAASVDLVVARPALQPLARQVVRTIRISAPVETITLPRRKP